MFKWNAYEAWLSWYMIASNLVSLVVFRGIRSNSAKVNHLDIASITLQVWYLLILSDFMFSVSDSSDGGRLSDGSVLPQRVV